MTPEARHIKFWNDRSHSNVKNKVDTKVIVVFYLFTYKSEISSTY